MTLIELLLVLVLLTVIFSLAAPALTGSFASTRLRRAGDEVIGAWSKARRFAVDSGQIYQFRFKPDDNVYRIEPFTTIDALTLTGAAGSSAAATAAAATTSGSAANRNTSTATASSSDSSRSTAPTSTADEQYEYEEDPEDDGLPDEVTFGEGQIAVDDPLQSQSRVATLKSTGSEWGRPILFYPDGTTSDASILLKNTRDQYVRVTLRGLTGVGRATNILSRAEASQPSSRRQ